MKITLVIILLVLVSGSVMAQNCTAPGQTPATAFPVCGTSTFQQTTVPICSSHNLVVPGCSGAGGAQYQDKNPYWYKFTCFQSGTLGFLISPTNQGDDYDWQLYDITGRNPDDVFTDQKLIVTGNWAGTYGNTGASASGVSFIQCASDPAEKKNSFSSMPQLTQGHTYLLMVSHYTDSQIGYNLSFGGGNAVITDPTLPTLQSAAPNCGGNIITVKLNKKIKCTSLASDGSDFVLTPANANIISAKGIGCANGFDTDSIELQLDGFLSPGDYAINVKNGNDGNTLLDYCDNAIPSSDIVKFKMQPLLPTPMDSMQPLNCAPQAIHLIFSKPIMCSSIAANGTDFSINGTYPVSIASATSTCTANGSTKEIIINLSAPLYRTGTFTLNLKPGSDGSGIIDECGQQTITGSLAFDIKDTVNADFSFEKTYGCTTDTVHFFHPGKNGVNVWQWEMDENKTSTIQNPTALYKVFDQKAIRLITSNGFCADTTEQTLLLDNFLKADFTAFEDNCPNEDISFPSTAQGKILSHQWNFGDGGTSAEPSPTYRYTQPFNTTIFNVTYTVTDSFGCTSTAKRPVIIYSSCYLAVPNAFTPNGDGKNDFLRILNAIKAEKLDFRIFNRWGQLVFKTNNWKQGWDGKINGTPQGSGVYVWFLNFTDRNTQEQRTMKGTALLIR